MGPKGVQHIFVCLFLCCLSLEHMVLYRKQKPFNCFFVVEPPAWSNKLCTAHIPCCLQGLLQTHCASGQGAALTLVAHSSKEQSEQQHHTKPALNASIQLCTTTGREHHWRACRHSIKRCQGWPTSTPHVTTYGPCNQPQHAQACHKEASIATKLLQCLEDTCTS